MAAATGPANSWRCLARMVVRWRLNPQISRRFRQRRRQFERLVGRQADLLRRPVSPFQIGDGHDERQFHDDHAVVEGDRRRLRRVRNVEGLVVGFRHDVLFFRHERRIRMSMVATEWAWDRTTGEAETKLLLLALARQAGCYDDCRPSLEVLAADLAMSLDEVRSGLDKLEAADLIRREDGGGLDRIILQTEFSRCVARRLAAGSAA
jgi:hypothetical protein